MSCVFSANSWCLTNFRRVSEKNLSYCIIADKQVFLLEHVLHVPGSQNDSEETAEVTTADSSSSSSETGSVGNVPQFRKCVDCYRDGEHTTSTTLLEPPLQLKHELSDLWLSSASLISLFVESEHSQSPFTSSKTFTRIKSENYSIRPAALNLFSHKVARYILLPQTPNVWK